MHSKDLTHLCGVWCICERCSLAHPAKTEISKLLVCVRANCNVQAVQCACSSGERQAARIGAGDALSMRRHGCNVQSKQCAYMKLAALPTRRRLATAVSHKMADGASEAKASRLAQQGKGWQSCRGQAGM
jgi:hypothetical protein